MTKDLFKVINSQLGEGKTKMIKDLLEAKNEQNNLVAVVSANNNSLIEHFKSEVKESKKQSKRLYDKLIATRKAFKNMENTSAKLMLAQQEENERLQDTIDSLQRKIVELKEKPIKKSPRRPKKATSKKVKK